MKHLLCVYRAWVLGAGDTLYLWNERGPDSKDGLVSNIHCKAQAWVPPGGARPRGASVIFHCGLCDPHVPLLAHAEGVRNLMAVPRQGLPSADAVKQPQLCMRLPSKHKRFKTP